MKIFIIKINVFMENNRFILQWKDYFLKAAEALENKNFDEYEDLMKKADDTYKLYREDSKLTYECTNFGIANYIFEDCLPSLFKTNKKLVKEFIDTIKNDKNLSFQFKFHNALKNIQEGTNKQTYINEALSLVKSHINLKTINESNEKIFTIIKENNIRPSKEIDENTLKYFTSCDYLIKNNPKLNNLNVLNENLNNVIEYCTTNHNINKNQTDLFSLMETFEKKYQNVLNEEEQSLVKEIMAAKFTHANENKMKLFNKFKTECIETINTLLETADNDDKDGLEAIQEQLNNMMFCEDTLVSDIAKLLEIRDILKS